MQFDRLLIIQCSHTQKLTLLTATNPVNYYIKSEINE